MKKVNAALICILFLIAVYVVADTPLPEKPPIPKNNPMNAEKIELGKQLFFDTRLSSSKTVSCNSCHNVVSEPGKVATGTDNLKVSTGIQGLKGDRNSPTVWNSAYRAALFWDGRASSLEEQAKGPLINPVEMGMANHDEVVKVVEQIPEYRQKFKKIFNSPISINEIAQAIAAYERTLVTPDSAFDLYLKGDKKALSKDAQKGWEKFNKYACNACHGAPTFSNRDIFVRFPVRSSKEYDYLYGFTKDLGRFKATKDEKDKNLWRVPSLRNVALTAPYFHNGSVDTLEQAVRIMGKSQLGREFSDSDVTEIVAFLKSLTGKIPEQKPPLLPK